jgi:hypothetical protein
MGWYALLNTRATSKLTYLSETNSLVSQDYRVFPLPLAESTKSNSRGRITNELVSDKQVSVTPSEEVGRGLEKI